MLYGVLFALSALMTYGVREWAKRKSFLDIPNARSSHQIPTPKGGGIAIVVSFYIGLWYLHSQVPPSLYGALWCGVPIAIVSLVDDMVELSSRVRLLVQSVAVGGALYFMGGVSHLDFGWGMIEGAWLNGVAFVGMLWLINLYNFMDGIDGYVAVETIIMGLVVWLFLGNILGWILIASVGGFLMFNWHKASIFMGDVGSATIGFWVAVWVAYGSQHTELAIWLVPLILFLYDATVTLLRRWSNGESITQAHKKHAYQRLVQSGFSHARVTLLLLGINLFLLLLLYVSPSKSMVLLVALGVAYVAMRYIDRKKAFV